MQNDIKDKCSSKPKRKHLCKEYYTILILVSHFLRKGKVTLLLDVSFYVSSLFWLILLKEKH